MRKPNPDPHPERSEAMEDISPERIVWRQIDRFLEAESSGNEERIHGSLAGLSALVTGFKDEAWDGRMRDVLDENTFGERSHRQFEEIIRLLDAKGKWLKPPQRETEKGKEWREGFQ